MLIYIFFLLVLILNIFDNDIRYVTANNHNNNHNSNVCEPRPIIHTAMIFFNSKRFSHHHDHKIYDYVHNFSSTIFADVKEKMPVMKFYPPVFTPPCEGEEDSEFSKGRGSNIAHKEVWDQFYRNRRPCGLAMGDKLIVFEYDAYIGMPDAGIRVYNSVKEMTSEFHYIGYCYKKPENYPGRSKQAPYCLHAYAMSLTGAKKLVDLVDACGGFADLQVANLCDAGNITWSFIADDYDHKYVQNYFFEQGIHMSGTYHYGGYIVQAKFDPNIDTIMRVEDGAVVSLGRGLYVFKDDHHWHLIPDMDTFDSLHFPKQKIVQLSDWQFRKYPLGDPIPKVAG